MDDRPTKKATAREALNAVLTPTDHFGVSPSGGLQIEDCDLRQLLQLFTEPPLFVISEATLRENYRRVYRAFSGVWPAPVHVLYAIKANNNLAVRTILASEGAGSDCFGTAEMYATFMGGADPTDVVLNGSNKTTQELAKAVELGVTVNIDAEDEIDMLAQLAEAAGCVVNVNLRLKIVPPEYECESSDYFGVAQRLSDYLRREKWGFSKEEAARLVARIASLANLRQTGFSVVDVGRVSARSEMYGMWAAETARVLSHVKAITGFVPKILDIGGGWARERDPEIALVRAQYAYHRRLREGGRRRAVANVARRRHRGAAALA